MRIINLFDIRLNRIKEMLPEIKEQGFDAIQISPLQKTKDENELRWDCWWILYQPINFEIGNNRIGSYEDLVALCEEARKYEILIIQDIVVNHLANIDSNEIKPNPQNDKDILNDKDAWKEFLNVYNWYDRYEVTHRSMGLPGLNPNNKLVQQKIIDMNNKFIDAGVSGFRIDAAKSIALPEEGCNFFQEIAYNMKKNKYGECVKIVYGEVLDYPEDMLKKYSKYMKVLTNYNYYGYWDSEAIIPFIEDKDNWYDQNLDGMGWTNRLTSREIIERYKELASKYPHTLYYPRHQKDPWGEIEGTWKTNEIKEANKVKIKKR